MALKDLINYSVNTDSSELHLTRYKSNIKKENNNENYYFFFRKLGVIFLLKKLFCFEKNATYVEGVESVGAKPELSDDYAK